MAGGGGGRSNRNRNIDRSPSIFTIAIVNILLLEICYIVSIVVYHTGTGTSTRKKRTELYVINGRSSYYYTRKELPIHEGQRKKSQARRKKGFQTASAFWLERDDDIMHNDISERI
jgi:hypothetical protein